MIFVCNTGPLIALAKLDRLVLLQHLGGTSVFIPPMVHKELWSKIGPEAPLIETALRTFIHNKAAWKNRSACRDSDG